ncbi:MAG: hypothetical protein EBZ36_18475 [Acidobacteria bacterium]|nr:hypothetical protein [Acidobacteriota bacterium]
MVRSTATQLERDRQAQPGGPGAGTVAPGDCLLRHPNFYLRGEALLTGIIPLLWWLTPADYTTTAPLLYAHENCLWEGAETSHEGLDVTHRSGVVSVVLDSGMSDPPTRHRGTTLH